MWLVDAVSQVYGQLDADGKAMVQSSIAPSVAILIFVFTQCVSMFLYSRERRREIKRILNGIVREIQENIRNAELFLKQETTIKYIKDRIRSDDAAAKASGTTPSYRPLIAITESSRFYDAVAGSVPAIKLKCLVPISAYYKSVWDQRAIANSIESYAFLYISVDSRCETIDDLWKTFKESLDTGTTALSEIKKRYLKRWFR